ncbi:MAG: amidohydrolase family protein [Prolixibacteraceae bacterium]|nr:amidohydrolase family protein [Prolixibacteraceae bacterium]
MLSISGCEGKGNYDSVVEGRLYTDNSPVRVEIKDGKILKISKIRKLPAEAGNLIIAPGLFDNQVNGYKGYSFVDIGRELTLEGIHTITKAFWEAGVTSYMPTVTTNSHDIFMKNFALLAKAKNDPETRGSIPGFHLEGPYISPVDGYRGAHPLIYVRKPDWNEFMELYNAAGKNILQVTLAPEVEGAMDFISKCRDLGIVVGLGHHNGSAADIKEAADRGAMISTHLGNGMANTINRHINPLWPQIAEDRLTASIICDGYHLQPEQIQVFYKTKGPDRVVITSDVSPLGGLAPGFYTNAIGDTLELKAEGVVVYPAQNVLSGSGKLQPQMIGHMMKVTGCSLAEAIQMTSTNNARLYGLNDRGEIKPGLRADIILFTMDDYKFNLKKTIVAGEVVYEAGS